MARAALIGVSEYPARRRGGQPHRASTLEMAAELGVLALADAGLRLSDVDGLAVGAIRESAFFRPSTVGEYMGLKLRFADAPDLGGATAAGMVWRAAAAIEAGIANVVLCVCPGAAFPPDDPIGKELARYGVSSYRSGSPQAEFEIPYGHIGTNAIYALAAQRYAHLYGYDPRALARLVVHQRRNACATPGAIFHGQPLTEDDVLSSPMIARPLRRLEIVMPVLGGAAVVLCSAEAARRAKVPPVWLTGYGEALHHKSPHYCGDMLDPPIRQAAERAYAMAGISASDIQQAQIYDCYTITVLMALEAAGFCGKGEGLAFLREQDMTYAGNFPLNTNGGQLGYGQAGSGMTHVVEAVRQLSGRAGERQSARARSAFVMGNGGIMSEQVALVLQADA